MIRIALAQCSLHTACMSSLVRGSSCALAQMAMAVCEIAYRKRNDCAILSRLATRDWPAHPLMAMRAALSGRDERNRWPDATAARPFGPHISSTRRRVQLWTYLHPLRSPTVVSITQRRHAISAPRVTPAGTKVRYSMVYTETKAEREASGCNMQYTKKGGIGHLRIGTTWTRAWAPAFPGTPLRVSRASP